MIRVIFVQPDGSRVAVEVEGGRSAMRAAVDNDVAGIRAECGGAAACATCQVLVDPEWQDRLPAPMATEASMLEDEETDGDRQRRLSCQIVAEAAIDGLVLHIPADRL